MTDTSPSLSYRSGPGLLIASSLARMLCNCGIRRDCSVGWSAPTARRTKPSHERFSSHALVASCSTTVVRDRRLKLQRPSPACSLSRISLPPVIQLADICPSRTCVCRFIMRCGRLTVRTWAEASDALHTTMCYAGRPHIVPTEAGPHFFLVLDFFEGVADSLASAAEGPFSASSSKPSFCREVMNSLMNGS